MTSPDIVPEHTQPSLLESAQLALRQTVEYAEDALTSSYFKLLSLTGAAVLTLPGVAGARFTESHESLAADTAAATPNHSRNLRPLPSVGSMEHCPIAVSVNVFTAGGSTDKRSGVSVQGKEIDDGTAVKYRYTVSKDDQFCGIMGVSGSLKGAQYKSLRPAKGSTPQKGSYTDYSLGTSKNGFHMNEFWVFARPADK